jgi:hypothetical protein
MTLPNLKKTIVLFVVIALAVSCGEDDPGPLFDYPGRYHKSTASIPNVRVFTINGEINNANVPERFDYEREYLELQFNQLPLQRGYLDTLIFESAQKAVLINGYYSTECGIHTSDNTIVLWHDVSPLCCTYGESITKTFNYNISRVKPEVVSEDVHSSTGGFYMFNYTGKEKFVLKRSGDKVVAPVIKYQRYGSDVTYGTLNNELTGDFYKHLSSGDTLVIATGELIFEKSE